VRPENLLRVLLIPLLFASSAAWAEDPLPYVYVGRWDLTLQTPQGDLPTWLDIADGQSAGPIVRMVGRWGHARRIPAAMYTGGRLIFVSPKEEEGGKNAMKFTLWLKGNVLVGETTAPDGTVWKIHGERAPSLRRKGVPTWQAPVTLFNGSDLAGWHLSDPKAAQTWVVDSGNLVSLGNGAELITDQKFEDFKLHVEFKVAPGANSGIYLRGRNEVRWSMTLTPKPPSAASAACTDSSRPPRGRHIRPTSGAPTTSRSSAGA